MEPMIRGFNHALHRASSVGAKTKSGARVVQNVARRDARHHMNKKRFGQGQLDKLSKSYDAIRGREQELIDAHGSAQSTGGTSGNPYNGIHPDNVNRKKYLRAARRAFGDV